MTKQKSIHDKLTELAGNLWWSWQPEVTSIFREIDHDLWDELSHNPILLLREYSPDRLEERPGRKCSTRASTGPTAAGRSTWTPPIHGETRTPAFSDIAPPLTSPPNSDCTSRCGFTPAVWVCWPATTSRVPPTSGFRLSPVGLFYHEGYFSQKVDEHGWQQEQYTFAEPSDLPMTEAIGADGKPVKIAVETRHGSIFARVWRLNVGRVPLYLLDTNIPENSDEDRKLTARLYGGDHRTRIRQEIMLGIGGVRALTALGINPRVIHMNEGHSAFAPLEIIRMRIKNDGLSFDDALRETAASGVFTTHTPVPAGHDRFDHSLIEEHLGPLADELGLGVEACMGLGRVDPHNHSESFCMTVLAFKTSRRANAVSNLHGVVSRRMWHSLWPYRSEEEIPIGHITNGVHVSTWLAHQMRVLYDKVLPANWHLKSGEPEVWAGFERVTPAELWETHQSLKNRLIVFARESLVKQAQRLKRSEADSQALENVLDPAR